MEKELGVTDGCVSQQIWLFYGQSVAGSNGRAGEGKRTGFTDHTRGEGGGYFVVVFRSSWSRETARGLFGCWSRVKGKKKGRWQRPVFLWWWLLVSGEREEEREVAAPGISPVVHRSWSCGEVKRKGRWKGEEEVEVCSKQAGGKIMRVVLGLGELKKGSVWDLI
ncbi:hypothetical protein HAX54_034143 [Datura stramonium]|uniref:Uncharacterized protein n=1 Tax=Datura stramonium TaxID=4076 RepID=A0ABS8VG95_DATST|nr:hypothetical protein [Datura stramonium]